MPLQVPEIDQRTYQEILDEAMARIRVHNPEWTNYNDSDPGITLLQLFSFMTENLLYRSRLIPERNRVKFLQLLGIPLQPARAAQGVVAFENLRGQLKQVVLERDQEVLAGKIPFRTVNGLAVLPVEGRVYRKAPLPPEREEELRAQYEQIFESFTTEETSLVLYETKQVDFPATGRRALDLDASTVDGTLWLALLARSPELIPETRAELAGKILTVGIVPEVARDGRVLPAGGPRARSMGGALAFHLPRAEEPLPREATERIARYRAVPTVASADVLTEPGLVQVSLPDESQLALWTDLDPNEAGVGDFPPALEGEDGDRVVTWIRIRPRGANGDGAARARVRLVWVGINAALVRQRAHVTREILGRGTGEPDQSYRVANTPVLTETLSLTVDGERWERVDDLTAAGSEVEIGEADRAPVGYGEAGRPVVRAYTVDRESGTVTFGDGIHGARPAAGTLIEASYDYGGGSAGVVGPDAITKGPLLPAGVKVTNPIPTWGGDDPMSVEEAERWIPRFLHHGDRAVSAEDFADIARATPGVDMGRVEVLPLFHPDIPDVSSPGTVTVMVVPRHDPANPDTPEPDGYFLDVVCEHLDPRRLLTTEVHVRGPEYVPIWASIGLDVLPGRDLAIVREAVAREIRAFLSALEGGIPPTGWPLATNVERLQLWAVANRVDGVAKVNDVLLTDGSGIARDRVELSGLQLPRLVAVGVQPGDPPPLSELRGDGPVEPAGPTALPVPIDPTAC